MLQEIFDLLLFLSDEIEMGRLYARDPAEAMRLAASMVAMILDVTQEPLR